MLPGLFQITICSYQEYKLFLEWEHRIFLLTSDVERQIISESEGKERFAIEGFCYLCNTPTSFMIDYDFGGIVHSVPNWRERLVCPICNLSNRQRAILHIFLNDCQPSLSQKIFLTEQLSYFYQFMHKRFPGLIGSEYLKKEIPLGAIRKDGVRNESLEKLSFNDGEFDFALCMDVLEHMPEYKIALREFSRILTKNGALVFTVPFHLDEFKNKVRAELDSSGTVVHLLEPLYHSDPLNSKGILTFHEFGWQLLDEVRNVGFDEVRAVLFWSRFYGYLGGLQIIFIARKK
ncbi:MAG: class I SAM-dependent methyltransferase [Candidatus Omnitrophica bacterium]|nr:class I SAM-dependent methyltransferase [Candidatus Omnitrophota bacterium]